MNYVNTGVYQSMPQIKQNAIKHWKTQHAFDRLHQSIFVTFKRTADHFRQYESVII